MPSHKRRTCEPGPENRPDRSPRIVVVVADVVSPSDTWAITQLELGHGKHT